VALSGDALEPVTSVADAPSAPTTSPIVMRRNRRAVSQEARQLPRYARVPDAAPTAVIALAMHCMHTPRILVRVTLLGFR
jgi:hypothetical protein